MKTLREMNISEADIAAVTKNSFHSFLSGLTYDVGYIAGKIAKIFKDFFG